MSELSKQALKVDNNQSFPNNNNGAITPSILRAFNVNMIDSMVDEQSYNVDSASWNQQIDSIEQFTSSAVTSAITASSLVTASFDNGTRNLTFTKGNGTTFAVNIPDVSGSTGNFATTASFNAYTASNDIKVNSLIAATGSYATTGSNTFTGNQTINAELILTGSKYFRIGDNQSISTGIVGGGLTIESQGGNQIRNLAGGGNITLQNTQGDILISGSATQIQDVDFIPFSASLNTRILAITGSGGTINTGSFATTGSNNFFGVESINDTNLAGLGSSNGEVYLLGRSGSLILSNGVSTPTYASLSHISSSQPNGNTNLIFKTNTGNFSTIVSGSGNIFTNASSAGLTGYVRYIGGSNNIFTTQLPELTGSAASVSGNRPQMNANFINHAFRIIQSPTAATHQYNNNIGLGTANTWSMNMQGNTGAVTVNHNLGINATLNINSPSRSIAELNAGASGSSVFQLTNNIVQGTVNYQGPVSSSGHVISQNSIAGTLTLNVQSGSRGLITQGNIINGAMTLNDNTFFAPALASNNNFTNNNINGTFIVNQRASSSINMGSNNINTWTLSNDMDASAITNANLRFLGIAGNVLFGAGNNNVYTSGSAPAIATQRAFSSNIFGGTFISASAVANGTDANMVSTIGVGHDLNIVGTARRDASNLTGAGATQGSAFFGRYNKLGQGFNTTAEVILAVGTGTSGSAGITRKTGFLIDSGSNSFFEGSLTVSGSTTLSGSAFINNLQNGVTANVVTYDTTTGELRKASLADITSASFDGAEFWSTITESGSAGVSGSITFNNSGSVAGISLVNDTQITLAQAGTYNIQFSAQVDTSAGADTVYLWFKKNGVNIADSASKAVLANNTAQIITVNILDAGVANDYYELAYQTLNGNATVLYEPASGNIPAIPSVILTVTQVR